MAKKSSDSGVKNEFRWSPMSQKRFIINKLFTETNSL